MSDIQRTASAQWNGSMKNGWGKMSTRSGTLQETAYTSPSRFENGKGTNPEELIAAAHAACFSMTLSKLLGDLKRTPREVHTKATLTLAWRVDHWKISKVHLDCEVSGDQLDVELLTRIANQAKEQCPVSVLLEPGLEEITLAVRLKGFSLK
jgi:osmotically inducible protein OsmC